MLTEKKSGLNFLQLKSNPKKDAKIAMIMLHGYGASMHDLYDLHHVINSPVELDWVFPDGHIAVPLGPMSGRAWFPIDMAELEKAIQSGQHRVFADKCPEEFLQALDKLQTFLEHLSHQYENVILGGFSQGAMLASHLGMRNEKVKAMILFSSTLLAKELLQKFMRQIPFFQSHGTVDPLLGFEQAQKLYELFSQHGLKGEFVSFNGGHEIPMPVINKLNSWLGELQLF